MKNSWWIAIALVTMLSLVCPAAFAVTPPYSENFEGGTAGNSVSTLGWRVALGDVKIGGNPGYGTGWGLLCLNGGANPVSHNVALYDFTGPITTGRIGLSFDAYSVNYQAINGEFGFVVPEYNADWPGIRWIGGLNTWRLYDPDGTSDWTYYGGGDQPVHLEINVDLDTHSVWGAITDSTGRHDTTVITYPMETTRSISGIGYAGLKAGASWYDCSIDNISVSTEGVPPPLGRVEGLITFQDFVVDDSPIAVRVQVMQGATEVKAEDIVITSSSGNYSIVGIPSGTYDVTFKAASWLKKTVASVFVPAGGAGIAMASLVNGDANGDNEVTNTDVDIVLKNM